MDHTLPNNKKKTIVKKEKRFFWVTHKVTDKYPTATPCIFYYFLPKYTHTHIHTQSVLSLTKRTLRKLYERHPSLPHPAPPMPLMSSNVYYCAQRIILPNWLIFIVFSLTFSHNIALQMNDINIS